MVRSPILPHPSQHSTLIHLHFFLRQTPRLLRLQTEIPNPHRQKALPCPAAHHHFPQRNFNPATWRPHLWRRLNALRLAANPPVHKLHRYLHLSKWLPLLQTKHPLNKKFRPYLNLSCLRNAQQNHKIKVLSGLRQFKTIPSPLVTKHGKIPPWMPVTSVKANKFGLLRIRTY